MGVRSGESWAQLITSFRAGPTAFLLAHGSDDTFLAELLQDLSSERISEQTKVCGVGRAPGFCSWLGEGCNGLMQVYTGTAGFYLQL